MPPYSDGDATMWSPDSQSVRNVRVARRLPGRHRERAGDADRRRAATLEGRQPRLERTLRRVHDAGVDVADLGQREQVGRVVGVAELERRRLIDRYGPGAGGRIGIAPTWICLVSKPQLSLMWRTLEHAKPDTQGRI